MADDKSDLMAQFEEFLNAKAEKAKAEEIPDFDVEIWDEKGRGARLPRSHAKPFLQTLGLDLDTAPTGDGDKGSDDKGGNSPKSGRTSSGPKSASPATGGLARKYFVKGD